MVIHCDPTPVQIKKWVETVGGKPETWIARHLKGQFPCLRKIGGEWYVMPAAVLKWSLDGNEAERRQMEGDLAKPGDKEAGELAQPDKPGGRGKAKSGEGDGMAHPLQTWRKSA